MTEEGRMLFEIGVEVSASSVERSTSSLWLVFRVLVSP